MVDNRIKFSTSGRRTSRQKPRSWEARRKGLMRGKHVQKNGNKWASSTVDRWQLRAECKVGCGAERESSEALVCMERVNAGGSP